MESLVITDFLLSDLLVVISIHTTVFKPHIPIMNSAMSNYHRKSDLLIETFRQNFGVRTNCSYPIHMQVAPGEAANLRKFCLFWNEHRSVKI